MCEVTKKIERTPQLARDLVEIRRLLRDLLDSLNDPGPKEAGNGTANVRHA